MITIPDTWRQRFGEYEIINPEEAFYVRHLTLGIDDGFLTAAVTYDGIPTPKHALLPLNDSEAIKSGLGRGQGKYFYAFNENNEEFIRYSGWVFRRANNSQ